MAILKTAGYLFPGVVGSVDCYSINTAFVALTGNTTVSLPLTPPCDHGSVRIRTDPAAMGVNAQVRILNIRGDDGKNTIEFYAGEPQPHGINQNIDFIHLWAWDNSSCLNVNVGLNITNANVNMTIEVAGIV